MHLLTTPATTAQLPAWVGPTVLIVTAVIALIGGILVARTRRPVGITDLWAENRSLRNDMNEMDRKFTARIGQVVDRQQVIGKGFVALSNGIERAKVKPILQDGEQELIDAARAAIDTDLEWNTVTKENKK